MVTNKYDKKLIGTESEHCLQEAQIRVSGKRISCGLINSESEGGISNMGLGKFRTTRVKNSLLVTPGILNLVINENERQTFTG